MSKSWYQRFYEKSLSYRHLKIKEGCWHNIKNCLITELLLGISGLLFLFLDCLIVSFLILVLMLLIALWQEKEFFEPI